MRTLFVGKHVALGVADSGKRYVAMCVKTDTGYFWRLCKDTTSGVYPIVSPHYYKTAVECLESIDTLPTEVGEK